MSSNYKEQHLHELANIVSHQYGFEIYEIHTNIVELLAGNEIPIIRLIYNNGNIIVCFHVTLPAPEAIQIFSFISEQFKLVMLGESYYENPHGETFTGHDALIAYETERENHYLTNQTVSNPDNYAEYHPEEPVTWIVKHAIYAADHPMAAVEYAKFKDRKKMF